MQRVSNTTVLKRMYVIISTLKCSSVTTDNLMLIDFFLPRKTLKLALYYVYVIDSNKERIKCPLTPSAMWSLVLANNIVDHQSISISLSYRENSTVDIFYP